MTFDEVTAFAPAGPGRLAFATSLDDYVAVLDLRTDTIDHARVHRWESKSITRLLHMPSTGNVLLAAPGPAGTLFEVSPGPRVATGRRIYDLEAAPFDMIPWSPDPDRRVLVAALNTTTFRPVLALYEPGSGAGPGRFLPRSLSLDDVGPIRRIQTDPRGRLFMLAPWAGTLLRVTPRP